MTMMQLIKLLLLLIVSFRGNGLSFVSRLKNAFHMPPPIAVLHKYMSNRLAQRGMFGNLSQTLKMKEPWNAPNFVWRFAWKLHAKMLPFLHYFDRCCPKDTFVNLSVLWWKAISGNNPFCPTFDGGIAYDLLPPIMRFVVSFPLCLLYPKLHHQTVAMRTAYLDQSVRREIELITETESSSKSRVHVLTLGAGFDTRSLRLAIKYNHTTWHEFDLPSVIQQKISILNRYLQRRKKQYSTPISIIEKIPRLYSIDMNEPSTVVKSLQEAFLNISIQSNDHIIFITEASLLYLNHTVVHPLLECIMKTSLQYVKPYNIKYCFSDRFPLNCTLGNVYDYDLNQEYEEAKQFLLKIGMKIDYWQIKPGRARHMGMASLVLPR